MRQIIAGIVFFLSTGVFGQSVTLHLKDALTGRAIEVDANVLFKDKDSLHPMEFARATKGYLQYRLKKIRHPWMEVYPVSSYQDTVIRNISLDSSGNAVIEVRLYPVKTEKLKPVVIEAKPVRYKKDTVVYDVSKFSDGSERKLKELLGKLPGIEVNEDGQIKYYNRPVSHLLIEGDDLFGENNYGVGTKNINASAIDRLEVLKHYSDNPMLHDVKKSDKIALNLKLKEGIADWSGDFSIAAGYEAARGLLGDFSVTGLQLTKNIKSLGVIAWNNNGHDYSGEKFSVVNFGQHLDVSFNTKARPYFNEGISGHSISGDYNKHNRQLYARFNTLIKGKKNGSFRLSGSAGFDRFWKESSQTTYYSSSGNAATIQTFHSGFYRPQVYTLNSEWRRKIGQKNYLIVQTDGYLKDMKNATLFRSDFTENFDANLASKHYSVKQRLDFTHRTKNQRAWQWINQWSIYKIGQFMTIKNKNTDTLFPENAQRIRKVFLSQFIYYKHQNRLFYGLTGGYFFSGDNYKISVLDGNLARNFLTDYNTGLFLGTVFNFSFGHWKTDVYLKAKPVRRIWENHLKNHRIALNSFLYDFSWILERKLGKNHNISFRFSFMRHFPGRKNWAEEFYLVNFYRWQRTLFEPVVLTDGNMELNYTFHDRTNDWFVMAKGTVSRLQGQYVDYLRFDGETMYQTTKFVFWPHYERFVFLTAEKFIYPWMMLIRFSMHRTENTILFSFQNNELEEGIFNANGLRLELSSGFKAPVNFYLKNSYTFNQNLQNASGLQAMQTSAGFIWLWNGWKTTVYSDWYFPDLSKKADYGFLNLKSEKKFEKSGWNVELSLFNLLNNTEIYKKEKSAFISSEETIALRGFHAMLRIAKEF